MKKLLSILIVVFFLSVAPAYCGDEWTMEDTEFQVAVLAIKTIDWLQTKEIARNPDYYEINPILGKHPSQNEVDLYFACSAIGHTVVAYYLPKKYRRIWQYVFIGISTGLVCHNYNAGIRINF